MRKVTIYGYAECRWCAAAKQFCAALKIPVDYRDIKLDPAARAELEQRRPDFTTVPQIFVGDQWIGGYDSLNAAYQSGQLPDLFGA